MSELQGSPPGSGSGSRGPTDIGDPSPDFIERVLEVVATIPSGRVMTYGDIAAMLADHDDLAGSVGSYGARLVGQVMSRFGHDSAWWRVIRATGHPPKSYESRAREHYEDEHTPLTGTEVNYRIDLKLARYDPGKDDDLHPTQASLI
jgi:alkylated DNA nucleotide flippase Atl1